MSQLKKGGVNEMDRIQRQIDFILEQQVKFSIDFEKHDDLNAVIFMFEKYLSRDMNGKNKS